ncbi:MAG: NAD(P)H-dependent oxidoreductase, partial [Pseudobutyrivibrio sp.]|nr:NAD(P)H-dependent oxidoreductase [Pseudobutyrivibrio sp.]
VFTTPVYVYHASAAMKNLLDHFAYRWMVHRPSKEMFGKRAVIITQCIGGGWKSAAKDIKDSLKWWGISDIKVCAFKLGTSIKWDKLPEKKKKSIESTIRKKAKQLLEIDYTKPAKVKPVTKIKFYIVRMIQTKVGKADSDYKDYAYWKEQGWIDNVRPWKK